jgi:hypothetical protein
MILPLVLSSHEEATVRCAKARPGSNSSTGSKAPVRLTTSGPHVVAKLSKLDPVFIDRCVAKRRHAELIPSDLRGGLNRSMQHHLIYVCSLKVVLNEARETVWAFCDREK